MVLPTIVGPNSSSGMSHTGGDSARGAQFPQDEAQAFYYGSEASMAPPAPITDSNRMSLSVLNPLSKHSQYTLHTPLPTTTEYVDPFIAVKEMLWLLPGINGIVSDTLDRMEKAFAYNSVYLLKIILDLQSQYLPLRPVSPEAMLSDDGIIRIACVLSGRLAKKDRDAASLSRELQLRTLISALSLLYQLNSGNLDSDSHARLLRHLTERDAHNEAKREKDALDSFRTGENEFLTRYGCDMVKCLQSGLSIPKDLTREAIHFLFAAGFIVSGGNITPTVFTLLTQVPESTGGPAQQKDDCRSLCSGDCSTNPLVRRHADSLRNCNRRHSSASSGEIKQSATGSFPACRHQGQQCCSDDHRKVGATARGFRRNPRQRWKRLGSCGWQSHWAFQIGCANIHLWPIGYSQSIGSNVPEIGGYHSRCQGSCAETDPDF